MQNSTDIEDEKLFYSIGEVADRYQVKHLINTILGKEFDIIKPRKTKRQ